MDELGNGTECEHTWKHNQGPSIEPLNSDFMQQEENSRRNMFQGRCQDSWKIVATCDDMHTRLETSNLPANIYPINSIFPLETCFFWKMRCRQSVWVHVVSNWLLLRSEHDELKNQLKVSPLEATKKTCFCTTMTTWSKPQNVRSIGNSFESENSGLLCNWLCFNIYLLCLNSESNWNF